MSDSDNKVPADDDAAEHALRAGLHAPVLSAEALQRIRLATEAEWRAATDRSSRRTWLTAAVAASVVTLALVTSWAMFNERPAAGLGAILAHLARAENSSVVEVRRLQRDVVLKAGAALRAGQSFEVRNDSLLSLEAGGNLRVARATEFAVVSANTLELERGELYVDIPPASRGNQSFVVVTPAGEFRHVGTQFAVAIVNGATRLRVREGSVRWHASAGDSTVDAGTEVLIDNRTVTRKPITTAGRDWAWAEAMAPDIDIENRPLLEFLAWFARETGRKLVLANDAARTRAENIRMHGNIRGLTAMEALTAVMASTSLRFELPEGVIRVSSTGEVPAPST